MYTIFSPVFFDSRISVIVRFLRPAPLAASAMRASSEVQLICD